MGLLKRHGDSCGTPRPCHYWKNRPKPCTSRDLSHPMARRIADGGGGFVLKCLGRREWKGSNMLMKALRDAVRLAVLPTLVAATGVAGWSVPASAQTQDIHVFA